MTEVRVTRSVIKPPIAETQKEDVTPKMPTKEAVVDFVSSKGGDFKHTLREIEMHFFGRIYNGKIPSEKSPYDMIYNRVVKAREILQKTHGGEWKVERTPTNERAYWLDKGEKQQQLTADNY